MMSPETTALRKEAKSDRSILSRRQLLRRVSTVGISAVLPLVSDVVSPLRFPIERFPWIDTYRAYNAFMEEADLLPEDEMSKFLSSIKVMPISDEISLGWGRGRVMTDVAVEVDSSKTIFVKIFGQFDEDISMPVVFVKHEQDIFLAAIIQSKFTNWGTVSFKYLEPGKHTFSFIPSEFSYLLLDDATRVQFFSLESDHPLMQSLLKFFPDKIGEQKYIPEDPLLKFREDMTVSLDLRDIRWNDAEYRVGLWHKCPKERGGRDPRGLWDDRKKGGRMQASVIDYDAMLVAAFTRDGVPLRIGWQEDTTKQKHDIIQYPASYFYNPRTGLYDTSLQRVGDHGMFTNIINTKRFYAPRVDIPVNGVLGMESKDELSYRDLALGVIGLRQHLVRGRMQPNDERIQEVIEDYLQGRDVITDPVYWLR